MRPTPIPDNEVWEGAVRTTVAPPDGDLTNPDIAPVEALVDHAPSGELNLSVRLVLEDDDLERLHAGGVVWLTFWGAMVPWSASVAAPATGSPKQGDHPDETRDEAPADGPQQGLAEDLHASTCAEDDSSRAELDLNPSQLAIRFAQEDLDGARAHLQAMVDEARSLGMSWADVGKALGVTRQSAWERFSGGAR